MYDIHHTYVYIMYMYEYYTHLASVGFEHSVCRGYLLYLKRNFLIPYVDFSYIISNYLLLQNAEAVARRCSTN